MDHDTRAAYLETEILTATPQKLRLMLIDAALRFASHALQYWEDRRHELADVALWRCRDIVAELVASIRCDVFGVAHPVRSVYAFLLKTLIDIGQTHDGRMLSQVIDVLQIERETWQELCRRLPEPPPGHRFGKSPEVTQPDAKALMPVQALLQSPARSAASHGGLCLEA